MILGFFSHRPAANPVAERGQLLYHYEPARLGVVPPRLGVAPSLATEAEVTVDLSPHAILCRLLKSELNRGRALFDELLSKEFRLDEPGRQLFQQVADGLCTRCSWYLRAFFGDNLEPSDNPCFPAFLVASRARFSRSLAEFRHNICTFAATAPEKCQLGITYSAERDEIGRKLEELLASASELIIAVCRYETLRKER